MDGKDYATALRQIADWYEANEWAPVPHDAAMDIFSAHSKQQAEALARALAPCRKEFTSADQFWLKREFNGITLGFCFSRSVVCERVVVGVTEIPAQVIPAHTVEEVEWRCAPLFQESEA